jgi:hypothetical protein
MRERDNIGFHLLHFLANDPKLFHLMQQITGCGRIGCFSGRVYRMVAGHDYNLAWHSDLPHRLIGMSINLSTEAYSGGIFQMRDCGSSQILYQGVSSGFGEGIVFRIAPEVEHRVSKMEGTIPKTAFAGWFKSQPDYHASLRQSLFELDAWVSAGKSDSG